MRPSSNFNPTTFTPTREDRSLAFLDNYERKTRLTPGLYGILPVATTVTTLGLDKFPLIAGLVGLLSATGGAWLLATLVGDLGRKAQPVLFEKWGGYPTTKVLRLREETDNPVQRDGWRAAAQRLTGVTLYTAAEETADPADADQRISAAEAQLLHLGQEGGEPAVRNENVAFGYQRNMYGFRHVGRLIAAMCVVIQVGAIFTPLQVSTSACIVGAGVATGFFLLWMFLPSETRAQHAAERHARQLFIAAQNRSR